MAGRQAPVAVHMWFEDGEGWAYHPAFRGKIERVVRGLDTILKSSFIQEVSESMDGKYLVGERLPDEHCRDPRAEHRSPFVLRVAFLNRPPANRKERAIIYKRLREITPEKRGPNAEMSIEALPPRRREMVTNPPRRESSRQAAVSPAKSQRSMYSAMGAENRARTNADASLRSDDVLLQNTATGLQKDLNRAQQALKVVCFFGIVGLASVLLIPTMDVLSAHVNLLNAWYPTVVTVLAVLVILCLLASVGVSIGGLLSIERQKTKGEVRGPRKKKRKPVRH